MDLLYPDKHQEAIMKGKFLAVLFLAGSVPAVAQQKPPASLGINIECGRAIEAASPYTAVLSGDPSAWSVEELRWKQGELQFLTPAEFRGYVKERSSSQVVYTVYRSPTSVITVATTKGAPFQYYAQVVKNGQVCGVWPVERKSL